MNLPDRCRFATNLSFKGAAWLAKIVHFRASTAPDANSYS
jgi:hypothetical protein